MHKVKCPYCGRDAIYTINYIANQYSNNMVWLCEPCDAYVHCHKGTYTPMGTLAKKPLRLLRMKVHFLIDPIWRNIKDNEKKKKKRNQVYRKLSKYFGREFHIGECREEECNKIINEINKIFPTYKGVKNGSTEAKKNS